MKDPRHGIPLKREETKYKQENPGYPSASDIKGILKHWAGTWEDWVGDLAGELKTAIKEYPESGEAGFEQAKALWDDFGEAMRGSAKQLIYGLHEIYRPDQEPPSRDANREILTDATKPPPPPFGGGNRGDDDDGDME